MDTLSERGHGKHVAEHVATCRYCWYARKELLHFQTLSKGIYLKCCNCILSEGRTEPFPHMTFPCGWWELRPLTCWCTYLDRFFYEFRQGHPILFVPRTPIFSRRDLIMLRVKELRLDYIVATKHVKFVSIRGGSVYSDDQYGCLHVSEIMTVKKFRKMYGLARYFLEHTRRKLHDYYRERTHSSILKFLPFLAIKRLYQVDATLKDCLRPSASGAAQVSIFYCFKHGAVRKGLDPHPPHLTPPHMLERTLFCLTLFLFWHSIVPPVSRPTHWREISLGTGDPPGLNQVSFL